MPEVYVAIRALLSRPNATIDEFAEVVSSDSMLALRVMRMAESQYFGFPRKCVSLHDAIGLIGLVQLHDLMLGSLCMRTFSAVPEEVLNLKAFWRYNVQCGIAARTVARFSKVDGYNAFFTLGLLHEIGHASMYLKAPEASQKALDISLTHGCTLAEAEQDCLGFDYAQVGSEMLQLWHLPPVYQAVAACHMTPWRAAEEFRPAVNIVHFAHEFCQDPRAGRHEQLISQSTENIPEFADLPPDVDDFLVSEIERHTDPILGLLWPRGAQDLAAHQGP